MKNLVNFLSRGIVLFEDYDYYMKFLEFFGQLSAAILTNLRLNQLKKLKYRVTPDED